MRAWWKSIVRFGQDPPDWWTWGSHRFSPFPEAILGSAVVFVVLTLFFDEPLVSRGIDFGIGLVIAGTAGLVWLASYLLDRKP